MKAVLLRSYDEVGILIYYNSSVNIAHAPEIQSCSADKFKFLSLQVSRSSSGI